MTKKFRDALYAIPFGRFRLDRMRQGESAIYVGREGQRAFLIDALTGRGRRGAWLITGRRGVGKSSFVDYCLREYEAASFRRFLRSDHGRSLADLVMLTVLAAAIAFVGLSATDLIEFFAVDVWSNPTALFPLALVTLVALGPMVLAARILWLTMGVLLPMGRMIVTTAILGAFIYMQGCTSLFGAGAPAMFMAKCLFALGASAWIWQAFGYAHKQPLGLWAYIGRILAWALVALALFASAGPLSAFVGKFLFQKDPSTLGVFILISLLGLMFGLATLAANGIFLFLLLSSQSGQGKKYSGKSKISWVGLYTLIPVILMTLTLLIIADFDKNYYLLSDLSILICLFIFFCVLLLHIRLRFQKDNSHSFSPPVEVIPLAKAFVLCAISLQLLYPLVSIAPEFFVRAMAQDQEIRSVPYKHINLAGSPYKPEYLHCNPEHLRTIKKPEDYERSSKACWTQTVFENGVLKQEFTLRSSAPLFRCAFETPALSTLCGIENDEEISPKTLKNLYFTLFSAEFLEEEAWAVIVFLLFFAFFTLEYEYINRPFIVQRESRVLNGAPRRPYQNHHHLDPIWWEQTRPEDNPEHLRDLQRRCIGRFRALEETTFPLLMCRMWMPSIIVRINLGFDSLDHRGVTHSMLFGLRTEYRRNFTDWRSYYGIIALFALVLGHLATLSFIGKNYVDFPRISDEAKARFYPHAQLNYCDVLEDTPGEALVPRAACAFAPEFSNRIFPLAYGALITVEVAEPIQPRAEGVLHARPAYWLVHFNNGPPSLERGRLEQSPSLSFRVYHLALMAIMIWLSNAFFRRFSLFPYRRTLGRIDDLMDALTLSRTDKRSYGAWSPARVVRELFSKDKETETSREALDPRSVELAFLSLLEEIQTQYARIPLFPGARMSIPTPEITFVFDELDKVGGISPPEGVDLGVNRQEQSAMDAERKRAHALQGLLSDMKRVICSAPARFIFVGGRLLHDEWIRDQNRMGSRQPLLSSIFDAELYLPSLMLDHSRTLYAPAIVGENKEKPSLIDRPREWLARLHASACALNDEVFFSRFAPFYALHAANHAPQRFFEDPVDPNEALRNLKVLDWRADKVSDLESSSPEADLAADIRAHLVRFLTHRSGGAPKRLADTLSEFVRPMAAMARPDMKEREGVLTARDALVFDDAALYRLQFVSSVFRHIEERFGGRILGRDDKAALIILFLFDFLMKLHGRAFTWANLERLDELAHIHRAPDLRRTLDMVLTESGERYFHRMLNGLFAMRFRSEFAMEIRRLSRLSEVEMAALNFTLDESQELKNAYAALLNASGEPNPEIVSALGELYEYDQAYEIARDHYERALRMIDAEFARQIGAEVENEDPFAKAREDLASPKGLRLNPRRIEAAGWLAPRAPAEKSAFVSAILSHNPRALRSVAHFAPWAVRRLRLMMQIGLTFEQSSIKGDLERAQAHYQAAQLLAGAVLAACAPNDDDPQSRADHFSLTQIIKHVNLFYQPVFANAWIAEKLEGGVDTSLTIVEHELAQLRRTLPFLSDPEAAKNWEMKAHLDGEGHLKSAGGGAGSNFALIGAELHNKTGDLYFYKGREAGSDGIDLSAARDNLEALSEEIEKRKGPSPERAKNQEKAREGREGYVFRAHYHYAVALHEIRRFVVYRRAMSRLKLNVSHTLLPEQEPIWSTHRKGRWPTFVDQAASNSLVDLADATMGRVSFWKVWRELEPSVSGLPGPFQSVLKGAKSFDDLVKEFLDKMIEWFESPDDDIKEAHNKAQDDDIKEAHNKAQDDDIKKAHDKALSDSHLDIPSDIVTFLGQWVFNEDEGSKPIPRVIGFGGLHSDANRLMTAIMMAISGAHHIVRAGFAEKGASEYLFVAETALRRIMWMRMMARHPTIDIKLFKGSHIEFMAFLAKAAVYALGKYDRLVRRARPSTEKNEYLVGYTVSLEAAVIACGLDMSLRSLAATTWTGPCARSCGFCSLAHQVEKPLKGWVAHPDPAASWAGSHELLKKLLRRHRFPMLSNMIGLKILIDESLLSGKNENNVDAWIQELAEACETFDAPMHFTPMMLAETLTLAVLTGKGDPWRERAAMEVWRAEQSFSMGEAYYDNISRMYYLFDDFNDRRLHVNHASQMAGADLLTLMRAFLRNS